MLPIMSSDTLLLLPHFAWLLNRIGHNYVSREIAEIFDDCYSVSVDYWKREIPKHANANMAASVSGARAEIDQSSA